jgi:phage-related protein
MLKPLIFVADAHHVLTGVPPFQKKSKRGIATPKAEMDLVRQRLRRAMAIDEDLEK